MWEYKTLKFKALTPDHPKVLTELYQEGKNGWEAVGMTCDEIYNTPHLFILLKKPTSGLMDNG